MDTHVKESIKISIRSCLKQFDKCSKEIGEIKRFTRLSGESIDKMKANLVLLRERLEKARERRDYKYQDYISQKTVKKANKYYNQYKKELDDVFKIESEIEQIESTIGKIKNALSSGKKLEELKKNIKTSVEVLTNAKQNYPNVYEETEKELDIYFLTVPKKNN